jgi:4-hydroxybenzoate polyprenyltransferase
MKGRPLDFIFLLRPAVMVPLWLFLVHGARLASRPESLWSPTLLPSLRTTLALVSMSCMLGGAYILNQIADIESDRLNDKLFLLPRGIISVRAARLELVVVWILALVAAFALPVRFAVVLAASLLLSLTYSNRPVRAKARAPLDLLWNAIGFGALGAAGGWTAAGATLGAHALPALSYVLAVAGITASTTIPDLEGDEATGLSTTVSLLGKNATSLLALILLTSAAIAGMIAREPVAVFGSLLSLPGLARAHASGRREDRTSANQIAVIVFALLVCIWSPYLLVMLGAVFGASRVYYRRRFGISYPGPGTP